MNFQKLNERAKKVSENIYQNPKLDKVLKTFKVDGSGNKEFVNTTKDWIKNTTHYEFTYGDTLKSPDRSFEIYVKAWDNKNLIDTASLESELVIRDSLTDKNLSTVALLKSNVQFQSDMHKFIDKTLLLAHDAVKKEMKKFE